MNAIIKPLNDCNLSTLLKASCTLTPQEENIIDQCQRMSFTTWVGYNDEKLVCAWGIVPPSLLSDSVYLWLHTTPAIAGCQFLFVRKSQIFIESLLKEYSQVVGHVKKDAPKSQKWLKWLGAEFSSSNRPGMLAFRIRKCQAQ